jgi:hypothetical protein
MMYSLPRFSGKRVNARDESIQGMRLRVMRRAAERASSAACREAGMSCRWDHAGRHTMNGQAPRAAAKRRPQAVAAAAGPGRSSRVEGAARARDGRRHVDVGLGASRPLPTADVMAVAFPGGRRSATSV